MPFSNDTPVGHNRSRHTMGKGETQTRGSVRVAAPFTLRCQSCRAIIPRGRRFNARKSTLPPGPPPAAIAVHRFAIRCPGCPARLAWRTDPATFGFECEPGAQRLHGELPAAPRGPQAEVAPGEDPVRRAERRAQEQRARIEAEAQIYALMDRRAALERPLVPVVENGPSGGIGEVAEKVELPPVEISRTKSTLAERRAALGIVPRRTDGAAPR